MIARMIVFACLFGMTVSTFLGTQAVSAEQQDEEPKKKVRACLQVLNASYQERDWETFKQHLTPDGWTQFKRHVVISTFMWCNPTYPVPLKDREKISEQLFKAYAEHGVSDVVAPNLNELIDGFEWEAYEEFVVKSFEAADKNLTQSMDHDGLLAAIADIMAEGSFPHFGDILFRMSKIESIEIEGETASVKLRFEPEPADGVDRVMVASQPFIVRFVQADNHWQFDGMDMKRTFEMSKNEFSPASPDDD